MASCLNSCSQSFLGGPATNINTSTYCSRVESSYFRPFDGGLGSAVKSKISTRSTVTSLLHLGRPTTVLGRVRSVIITAFNCMRLGWSFSHIGKEIFKRVTPTITNNDTALTIAIQAWIVWVMAALDYLGPRFIFSCGAHAVGAGSIPKAGPVPAPATANATVGEHNRKSRLGFATFTLTNPPTALFKAERRFAYDGKTTECLPNEVLKHVGI